MKETTRDWVAFTKRDLLAAESLLAAEELQDIVAFHCQQAIEKVFKALLEEHGEIIPRIHSTFSLHERLPSEIKNRLPYTQDELEMLDKVYLESRYPLDTGLLHNGFSTQEEAQRMVDLAKRIVNQCLEILGEQKTGARETTSPAIHPSDKEQTPCKQEYTSQGSKGT